MYFKETLNKFDLHIEELLNFVSENDIEKKEYIPKYFIDMDNYFVLDNITIYNFKVHDFRLNNSIFDVDIKISDNKLSYCSCNCELNKITGSCYHIVNVINQYSDNLFNDVQNDNIIYTKFLQKYKFCKCNSLKKEVNLELIFNVNNNHVDFKVMIGENKLYSLLSHFDNFYDIYLTENGVYEFGKDFTYNPNVHFFSNVNNRLINALSQYIYTLKYNRDLALSSLFNFISTNNIPFRINNHLVNTIINNNPLKTTIFKEENKYRVLFNYKNIIKICKNFEYIYFEGNVYYLKNKDRMLLQDLFDNDFNEIIVSKDNFSIFADGILNIIKNNLEIDSSAKNDIEISVLSNTELYFDIEKDNIKCKIIFNYKDNKVNYFDKKTNVVRDYDKENIVINDLAMYGFNKDKNKFIINDLYDEVDFLEKGLDDLANKYSVYTTEKIKSINVRKKTGVNSFFSIGKDNIFNFSFNLDNIDSKELNNIFKDMELKKKYYRLKNGDILNLEDDNLIELNNIVKELNFSDEQIFYGKGTLPKYKAIYLDSIKNNNFKYLKTDNLFDDFIDNFYKNKDSKLTISNDDLSILRDYQLTGVNWLYNIHTTGFGGILADEMGLGKTIQTIYYIKQVLLDDKKSKFLIVVPTSLVYNWKHEFNTYADEIELTIITGIKKNREKLLKSSANVFITSYGLLREDAELYNNMNFNTMFIDEAQSIKNHFAGVTRVVKTISADTKFALTGTPVENSPLELWSIFDYIMPGYLSELDKFRSKYSIKEFDDNTNVILNNLTKQIKPFILRRKKVDVTKDLPSKFENNIYVELTDEQKKVYVNELNNTKNEINSIIKDGKENNLSFLILPLITKLRQLCIDPKIVYNDYTGGTNKIDTLLYVIKNNLANDNKVLMFTSFRGALNIVADLLKDSDIPYYIITGDVNSEERIKRVNDFNNSKKPAVFLIMLKAGGTGLNLTSATTVIHLDLWWNPQAENQATDRAHRIGQTKNVEVIHIITKGTIEERILELQKKKLLLSHKLIDGDTHDKNIISTLTKDDIMELLSNENKD